MENVCTEFENVKWLKDFQTKKSNIAPKNNWQCSSLYTNAVNWFFDIGDETAGGEKPDF